MPGEFDSPFTVGVQSPACGTALAMRPVGFGVKITPWAEKPPEEIKMAGVFDDHATVMALQFLVSRLVVTQCLGATNPEAALADWIGAMEAHRNRTMQSAYSSQSSTEARSLSVAAASELGEIRKAIAEDFVAARRRETSSKD